MIAISTRPVLSTVRLSVCLRCGVPHVPDEIKTRVQAGERVTVEIIYPSGVAGNVLRHGTGALNIDESRIPAADGDLAGWYETPQTNGQTSAGFLDGLNASASPKNANGRWPANVAHDGSPEVLDAFARFGSSQSGVAVQRNGGGQKIGGNGVYGGSSGLVRDDVGFGDTGTVARFFFCGKADASERVTCAYEDVIVEWSGGRAELIVCADTSLPKVIVVSEHDKDSPQRWSTWLFGSGLTDLCQTATACITSTTTSSTTGLKTWNWLMRSLTNVSTAGASNETMDGGSRAESAERSTMSLTITVGGTGFLPGAERVASGTQLRISVSERQSAGHPTIKPLSLMEWLVRLVCPVGGKVLDPFCGTGSTLVACDRLGFEAVGIEQDAQTVADAHEKLRRMRARRMIGNARPAEHSHIQMTLDL